MKKTIIAATAICITSISIAQKVTPGINLTSIDSSVSPRNDFYKFANGKWLATQQIPASDGAWGAFNEINDHNVANLKALLTEVSKDTKALPGTNQQKIRDFYLVAIDSVKTDKDGITPIKADLVSIDAIKTKEDLIKTTALLNRKSIDGMIGFIVYSDLKSSNENACYLGQTGTGLPDKDFYFEPQYASVKKEYEDHITRMFECLGNYPESAKANSQTVMKIETELAKISQNATEQRDVQKQYNPFTKAALVKLSPNINWDLYFATIGIKTPENIILANVKYYEGLNTIINTITIPEWKVFLKWNLMSDAAPYLSSKFVAESFKFNGTVLAGKKQMKPRYKRVQASTDEALGEALGQLFVEKYFNSDSKARVNTMVTNLVASYRDRIDSRDWMDATTKAQAHLKLDKLIRKIGFPDTWIDYKALKISKDSYWKNITNARVFQYNRMLNKIGKPVDRMEWAMTPPTINAYYNPTSNEIAFPAGIMQAPFFDANADDAFNYGIMGSIIGHELTHGFDDQGAQFDADGNMKMWWTDGDYKNFKEKTGVIIDQFNSYIAIDTLHVNGELTQGENIADLGGLTMAYYAYKKSLKGTKSPVMAGFTGEQRFFLAWAQGWKVLTRDAYLKQMIATNPHSPNNFRAMGPLTNMPEFYEAFGVKEGDGMYRTKEKRVAIW